jgi:hypothetical protein
MPFGRAGLGRRCGAILGLLVAASAAQAQVMADGMGITVDALKDDLVARLADCETGGKTNRDAAVTADGDSPSAIGRLQFQIRTVMAFTREIEDRRIDAGEAHRIARDAARSADLAKKIIFERDGARHWHNCARKLGLYQEVKAIQRIESSSAR